MWLRGSGPSQELLPRWLCHFLLPSTVVSAPSISYHLLLLHQTTLRVKDTETTKQTPGLGKTLVNDPPQPWEFYTV